MALKLHTRTVMCDNEPAVRQPDVNGWQVSYNPDDARWYINHPTNEDFVRHYKDQRNALYFARTHSVDDVK